MKKMQRHILAPCFLAVASAIAIAATPATAASLRGEVVRIIDGDTIDVLVDKRPMRVRLADIDAPERGQPFGEKSRQHLAGLVFRREVRVVQTAADRYGRTLGTVYLQQCAPAAAACSKHSINWQMVQDGMAWAYRFQDRPSNPAMAAIEHDVRQRGIGLWSDSHAVAPWKWRRIDKPE